ncbi:MAG: acyl-CoA dehydrogenase [Myxococcales bacterium]|nr:MAG: acyl-CoA dehydrogenase [Myxococcales bacterium]
MRFELTDEQKMIRDMTRRFADDRLKPIAAEIDRNHRFPKEIVAELAELGLLGVAIPEEWGGAGMDHVAYAIAIEEISRGCASTGVILSVNNSLYCDPVHHFGTDAIRERYLKPFASGKKLGCFGLTESGAGTDAGGTRSTAIRNGDHWLLNGTKNFITNGREADATICFFRTSKTDKHAGISAFLVPSDAKGFSVGKVEDKLGICGSSTTELVFEDVRVPIDHLLGEEGQGFKVAMHTLDGGRIGIASQALGIAQAAFEAARDYSLERKQFGKPIGDFQAIQWMLADMATRIEAARLLVYRAAAAKDAAKKGGGRYSKTSAMAKLFASETAMWVTTKAIQVFGGYGYTKDYPVERHFRDAKITEIYEGTSEVQRMVIAAAVLKESPLYEGK